MRFRYLCISLWCLGLLRAQETRLLLEPLVEEALANNREIAAAQKRLEAARQRPSQESSLPEPLFSLGYTSNGSPRPFAGIGREPTANAGFMVSQEIPFPGKRKLRGEIAGKEAEAEVELYRGVQLDVLSRLKQAYHRLHHAYAAVDVMRRNRDLLEKFIRVAEIRYSVGRAAQQDIFKAHTQRSILETEILRMEQDRRSAAAEINSLLDRAPGSPLGRPPEIAPGQFRLTLEQLYAHARRDAPLLRRERKMIERSQLAVNLARKDYYPDYTVSGGYFNMGAMPDMYQFRVDFQLPAYFWRKQRAGVAEQALRLNEARRNYEAADQSVSFRIQNDYLMAQASFRLMEMYTRTVIPQTALALESSLPGYETGAVDFLSLLTNFMNVVEYERKYHEEMLNFHLALARLEAMTGLTLSETP